MKVFTLILIAGLAVCGWLVQRHHRRVTPAPAAKREVQTVDAWPRSLRLDTRTDYATGATDPLLEKLRREEKRQRPQEGRN